MDWAEASRTLGVSETATDTEIKEQYLYKAQLLHPDKNLDKPESVRKKAEAELAIINQVYTFLNNSENNPYKKPPKLAIEPKAILFKDVRVSERKSTTIIVRNIGGPYTSIWIDNNPAAWLTVAGVKSTTSERLPLEITLECTGIGEPGSRYAADLLIKLENEKTRVVDHTAARIELTMNSESAADKQVNVATPVVPVQPLEKTNKKGFSLSAFLVNLFAFACLGVISTVGLIIFFEINLLVYITAWIIYSAIALIVCINHAITVGSKPRRPR